MRLTLYLALKYLSPFRPSSLRRIKGAVLAVALSLIPLILVLEVSDGMIQGITSRILEVGTYHLQVSGYAPMDKEGFGSWVKKIEEVPGVESVALEYQGVCMVYSPEGRAGATVRAISSSLWKEDPRFKKFIQVKEGEFDLSPSDAVVLGSELASRLKVTVGDTVKLLTPYSLGGDSILSRISTFTVRGIASAGYQELDKLWIYIPVERHSILSPGASRSLLGIKVQDPFGDLSPLVASIYPLLPQGYHLYTWSELESARYLSFKTTRYLLIFIMMLILSVASVNISSTLIMLQIEKKDEIAVMKSYGFSPQQVVWLFLGLGVSIGLLGTVLGVGIGLALSVSINEIVGILEYLINNSLELAHFLLFRPQTTVSVPVVRILNPEFYLEKIPVVLKLSEVLGASLFAILVSILSSYFPARAAGALKPLEVLSRH